MQQCVIEAINESPVFKEMQDTLAHTDQILGSTVETTRCIKERSRDISRNLVEVNPGLTTRWEVMRCDKTSVRAYEELKGEEGEMGERMSVEVSEREAEGTASNLKESFGGEMVRRIRNRDRV